MKAQRITLATITIALACSTFSSFALNKPATIDVVVHGGLENPFWKMEEQGVRDVTEILPDATVRYLGPRTYNFPEFMSILQTAIESKPDALVCTLTEPVLMDDLIRPAIAEGLPIIAINADDMRPQDQRMPVQTYIGEDSYQVGVLAAQETLRMVTPKRAIFGNHHNGAANIRARGEGFCETLKKNGVPADEIDISIDPVTALERIQSYRVRHPDANVIFLNNEVFAQSLLAQLEGEGITVGKDMYIIMMDTSPLILQYVIDGKFLFAIDQQAYFQSYLGVLLAWLQIREDVQPPQGTLNTGPVIVDRAKAKELLADRPVPTRDFRIALVTDLSQDDPEGLALRYGAHQAANLLGDVALKDWSKACESGAQFIEQAEKALANNPDALVCSAREAAQLETLLKGRDIPLILIDSDTAEVPSASVLTMLGNDRYHDGKVAAERSIRQAKPRKALFVGTANDQAAKGWSEAMDNAGIFNAVIDSDSNAAAVADQVIALYREQPEIDVAMVADPALCAPIIEALEAKGYHVGESIRFAAMDINPAILNQIMLGKVMFAASPQPYLQGFLSIVFAERHWAKGLNPPRYVPAGTIWVDDTNMGPFIQ